MLGEPGVRRALDRILGSGNHSGSSGNRRISMIKTAQKQFKKQKLLSLNLFRLMT
ncbi:hypothetical protein ALC53_06392 [Atta colombica]|uniref:Uncharacterized protein n=1 Tax=Atta colombica TaxID=520822 RepID=A0A195BG31_9HYME|nr:hypothetical protein ALC53_06392 [Atta colombica]